MILAGASCDDIFVIVLFSTFVTMAQGGSAKATDFLNIPVSIILGVLLGSLSGFVLFYIFEISYRKGNKIRNSTKVIAILGLAFLLMSVETFLKPYVAVSGLLAVVAMACVIKIKADKSVSARLSEKFGKLWIAAEAVLLSLLVRQWTYATPLRQVWRLCFLFSERLFSEPWAYGYVFSARS